MMQAPFYLYCFARAANLDAPPATGADGEPPLIVLRAGEIAAVLAQVATDEFCGDAAEARLADPAWIARKVAAHTAVIASTMERSPVFPARLGTLFSSADRVIELMRQQAPLIARVLERVDGKAEWAVKAWLDRSAAIRFQAATDGAPDLAALPAGFRYLRERQLQAQASARQGAWLEQTRQEIATRLLECAFELRSRPVRQVADGEVAANWAALVAHGQLATFGERVAELNREYANCGIRLDFTGPWPPYSFCVPLTEAAPCPG